jgi:multiple sugar transport system substrate-binding protein
MMKSRITQILALSAILSATALTGCSGPQGQDNASTKDQSITVWSLENQPDRVKATKAIAADFTKKTGIKVDLVGIDEGQIAQLAASAAMSGKLPDVMGALSLSEVRQFDTQKLLNTDSPARVLKNLDPGTFEAAATNLDKAGDRQLAVPDSAYAQILVYRKDLFKKAGLQPPTSYANLEKAAQVLSAQSHSGITLATDPSDVFTSQTFESMALGNGCDLVDDAGNIQLTSPACQKTWDLYGTLAQKYSPKGTQTVDTTRASYFAGESAMVDWSTFILDEMAGLRNDALPTCPECKTDPQFLAKNSGIVTSISGSDGQNGATYGEVTSWAVTKSAKTDASEKFIQYMLSDGYLKWLGLAPEGKFPLRHGDAGDAQKYSNGWKGLLAGVDTKKKLSDVYDAQTLEALRSVPSHIDRWAIPQNQGALLGPLNTQLPIAKAVADVANGSKNPEQAAQMAADAANQIKAKQK